MCPTSVELHPHIVQIGKVITVEAVYKWSNTGFISHLLFYNYSTAVQDCCGPAEKQEKLGSNLTCLFKLLHCPSETFIY